MAQRDRRAARDLVEVARVIAQRNALLRAIRAEEAPLDALGFWDEQLAQIGCPGHAGPRWRSWPGSSSASAPLHDAVATDGERDAAVGLTYIDALKDAWPERADPGARMPDR